jgi:hypothetical protein
MRVLSEKERAAKLKPLCEIEGFPDEHELFASAINDSVCPAICCNPDSPTCDYTAEMEPDQERGWCDVRARDPCLRARARRAHLMSGERFIYALTDWTVEKRAGGWYFSRSRSRHSKNGWRGPYRSEASVAMMIARELRREIVERHACQVNGRAR